MQHCYGSFKKESKVNTPKNVDNYEYWENALKGTFGPVHEGDPQCGYYRKRNKYGPDYPLAIWIADGKYVAVMGFNDNIQSVSASDEWTYICQSPISYEAYQQVTKDGKWPDDVAPSGHNLPDDPHQSLSLELEGDKELAEEFLKSPVETQELADKAASWSKKLSEIAKKADNFRKVDKQPHLDAGKAVDDLWNPIRDDAKDLSTKLKRHLDAWLRKQAEIERERQAKAQAEADAKRLEAEKAASEARTEDDAKRALELAQEQKAIEREAKERNAQAGRTGSKVSLVTVKSGEITNYDELLNALKDRAEIKTVVQSLANRAAKSDHELPGMKIITEKRAR